MGNVFMKWVHNNRANPELVECISITKNGDSYVEFPDHDGLKSFDPSDRKFVAVANKHSKKPHIVQGTDSKWWEWKDPLHEVGIEVVFLCPDYVEEKCKKKLG